MSILPSLPSSPSQSSEQDPELRGRVSAAFEKLAATAPELNAASDELAKPIHTINKGLQTLNLGVSAWVEFSARHYDDGEILSVRSIGYAKVSRTWGIAIRYTGTDSEGDPVTHEWQFNDAPRSYRLEALDTLPALLDQLAETAGKTAAALRNKIAMTEQVATTISQLASSSSVRSK